MKRELCVCEISDLTSFPPLNLSVLIFFQLTDTDAAEKKHISVKQSASPQGGKILKMKRVKAQSPVESYVKRFKFLPICAVLTFG